MFFILRLLILSLLFGSSLLFASIGKVSLLKGEASLERAGAVLSVKNEMNLEEKDSIKTTKGSQIQLIFTDKTVITLGSESHFKVNEYLSEGSSPKAKFKFNQGTFKTITGKIGKSAPENFTLETKTATIGIRGTVIGGAVPPPSSSAPDTIICLGGQITATSLRTGVTVNLPAGTITVVPTNGPPAPPRQATPQDIAQFNQSLGSPPQSSAPEGGSSSSQGSGSSSSGGSQASSEEAPPAPPPPPPAAPSTPQSSVPTSASAAQQTNQQNLAQSGVVGNIAQGLGVPVEQIQQQVISGNPIIPTPPPVEPTPPPVEPTPPPVEPTPPPVEPTPPPSGGYTPPPQPPITPEYTTLFSNMSASDGTSSTVLFPEEITKIMAFDATNKLWRSSDNSYIVTTTTDGNFSYIHDELTATQTMYVKDSVNNNTLLFKSFPTDSGADGYLTDVSGLVPIPASWKELVTSVGSVMSLNGYTYAIKDELSSQYTKRKWDYTAGTKLFQESYYDIINIISPWVQLSNFAALYSDISNSDITYQSSLSSALSDYMNGANFYIYGVPEANQNIKSYGTLQDGGKWYFIYNNVNSDFNNTVSVYGTLPITDAVAVSSDSNSVPFMQTTKGYPIYIVDRSGSKEMYSIKNFDSTSNDMFNYVNNHFLEINTDYVTVDGSNITYTHLSPEYQQNVYLFYKIDDNGTLVEDARNGKIVNPITGNVLHVYTNYHTSTIENNVTVVGAYAFGPINNPELYNRTLPTPQTAGNTVIPYNNGITPLSLNMSVPATGADFRKLAIEKAPWSDKPFEEEVHIYSDYSAVANERDFNNIGNTQTYIKYPASSNGIMMESNFEVFQEKDGSDNVVKNYLIGSVTTGRVVENTIDGSNKVIFKHFDTMDGIVTSSSELNDRSHNMYLFNEGDQFVNADIGGLDNEKVDEDTKYNWFVHEEIDVDDSEVVSVELMKKVADNTDMELFKSVLDYTPSAGEMSGFMLGGDTSANIWMGDITAFDTKDAGGNQGLLTIVAAVNELSIASPSPISMAGLTQTNSTETLPSASFVGEDMQAMIIESKTVNSKTYDFAMATLPDVIVNEAYSYQNDYSSWGYWVATEKVSTDKTYAQGYWVAGYETPTGTISAITPSTTYSYIGNVLGSVTNGTLTSPILLDVDNSFNADITFGTTNPVTITEMKFNTADLGVVETIGTATTLSNAISGNTFSGVHDNTSGTVVNFKGKFYGPSAESIGGAWSGAFNNGDLTGTGVFKAVKTGVTVP